MANLKPKTLRGVQREYRTVMERIAQEFSMLGGEGDPFQQDLFRLKGEPHEIESLTNLVGWARALGWVLGVNPSKTWRGQ